MGLFDKFKKKEIKEENKIKNFGWDAITEICETIYPNQKNPKH